MEITVSGNTITATGSVSGTYTLSHNREEISENGTGIFQVDKDGVYFVNDIPCMVTAKADQAKAALWEAFMDSGYREDSKPYEAARRFINVAKALFAKSDFFGANKKLSS